MSNNEQGSAATGDELNFESAHKVQRQNVEDLGEQVREFTELLRQMQNTMQAQAQSMQAEMRMEMRRMQAEMQAQIDALKGPHAETKEHVRVEAPNVDTVVSFVEPEEKGEGVNIVESENGSSDESSNSEEANPWRFVESRSKRRAKAKARKSILKAGNAEIEVESDEDDGTKVYNFKANNSKHPKIPEARTIDPPGLIKLEKDYEEYKKRCRSKGLIECSIVDCFSTEAMEMLRWGDNVISEREVTEDYVWNLIEEAKKRNSIDRSGLILKELPTALEGKFDLKLQGVKTRMQSLWTALKRYLKESGTEYFLDENASGDLEANKLRRSVIVGHLCDAIKPVALRKTIARQLEEHPIYKFSPIKFYDLVIKEGETFEHIFRQNEANKDTKSAKTSRDRSLSEGSFKKRKKAYNARIKARMVKTIGATCSFCKERDHHFLIQDEQSGEWRKNCPKKCDGDVYPKLKREEMERVTRLKANAKARLQSKGNMQAKQANAEVPTPYSQASHINTLEKLCETLTNAVANLAKLGTGNHDNAPQQNQGASMLSMLP